MNNLLKRIWENAKSIILIVFRKINNKTSVSGKKFQIERETEISNGKPGFKIVNATRPRKCPRCNSNGTIVKHNQNSWKCNEAKNGCGFIF